MSYKNEPAIQSCETGHWVPYFDSCPLILTMTTNIKHSLHMPWTFKPLIETFHIRRHEGADVRIYIHMDRRFCQNQNFLDARRPNFLTHGAPLSTPGFC